MGEEERGCLAADLLRADVVSGYAALDQVARATQLLRPDGRLRDAQHVVAKDLRLKTAALLLLHVEQQVGRQAPQRHGEDLRRPTRLDALDERAHLFAL